MNQEEYLLYRDRVEGCLIGGAVGDALGYRIKFCPEEYIFKQFGKQGIHKLTSCICDFEAMTAPISDDTQMTLFAGNALVWQHFNGGSLHDALWLGYQEWLRTQENQSLADNSYDPKMWLSRIPELYMRRDPGSTCLFAIRNSEGKGTPDSPLNKSKECGTVMRAAPFGLAWREKDDTNIGIARNCIRSAAIADAALTHGHPIAHGCSAILALIVYEAVNHRDKYTHLEELICFVIGLMDKAHYENVILFLHRTLLIAKDQMISTLNGIHLLGGGWMADEALAIAIFCAVRYQNDFAAAICAAVNHKGNSDSTGAICGNILGAWLGKKVIDASMDTSNLELTDTILRIADDLIICASGVNSFGRDVSLYDRYRYAGRPIYPQYILDVVINDSSADNLLLADAVIMPSSEHFFSETETIIDPTRPIEMLGSKYIRCEPALSPRGPIYMIKVDVPKYAPDRQELLISCYCAALIEAIGHKKNTQNISLPLLGTEDAGWPAKKSAACMLRAIHHFYDSYYATSRMPQKIFLCAKPEYQPVLRDLQKNRSLAFLSLPIDCNRYDPVIWRELRHHFMNPFYNALKFGEFLKTCLELLEHMTNVKPGLKAEGIWKASKKTYIPVSFQTWLQLLLPSLLQRFLQLWPETCPTRIVRKRISYYNEGEFEWLLPELPLFENLLNPPKPGSVLPQLKPLRETGMIYTPLTQKALNICFLAHKDQKDKSGLPYVFHPFHVAEQLETESEICTALLHDVLEDSSISLQDISKAGFGIDIIDALKVLTHQKDTPYMEYIEKVRENPIARRVKLADLRHNSDTGRLSKLETKFAFHPRLSDLDTACLRKYGIARAFLEDDEYDTSHAMYCKRIPLDTDMIYTLLVFYTSSPLYPTTYMLESHDGYPATIEFSSFEGHQLLEFLDKKRSLAEVLSDYLAENSSESLANLLQKINDM